MEGEKLSEKADARISRTGIDALDDVVTLHRKIGSGTFSSVFLASLRAEGNLKRSKRKLLAIKRLIPTSNPRRIEQELKCLVQIGGVDNVGGIEACVRQGGLVAFVMPYMRHDKFHEYFDKMDPAETKIYVKNLLIALRRVHSFNIIHRDVKPSNFLYDREQKRWLLVDFGLAQEVKPVSLVNLMKRKNEREEENNPPTKRLRLEESTTPTPMEKTENKSGLPSPFKSPLKQNLSNIPGSTAPPLATAVKSLCLGLSMNFRMMDKRSKSSSCMCYGKSQVCNVCIVKREIQASRAGTPGYRPPEVLLKYPQQSTAVDVWACGVIFLSLLSKSYPFFKAHDDFTALAEMITVFGDKRFKHLAVSLERNLKISCKRPPTNLRKLCVLLRRRTGTTDDVITDREAVATTTSAMNCMHCQQSNTNCLCATATSTGDDDDEYEDAAYDLLQKLLELDPRQRITAEDALKHPYFMGNTK